MRPLVICSVTTEVRVRELEKRAGALECLLGRKIIETKFLRESLEQARQEHAWHLASPPADAFR